MSANSAIPGASTVRPSSASLSSSRGWGLISPPRPSSRSGSARATMPACVDVWRAGRGQAMQALESVRDQVVDSLGCFLHGHPLVRVGRAAACTRRVGCRAAAPATSKTSVVARILAALLIDAMPIRELRCTKQQAASRIPVEAVKLASGRKTLANKPKGIGRPFLRPRVTSPII